MPIYNRNKVRLELIPYIQDNFNPNIVETLWRTSHTSKIDSNYLDKMTREGYDKIVKEEGTYKVILDGIQFLSLHRSIQNRLIRLTIFNLIQNIQGISEYHVSSLVNMFLDFKTGKQMDLPNGLIARVSYNDLIIQRKKIGYNKDYYHNLSLGENIIDQLDLKIIMKIVDKKDIKKGSNTIYIDFNKIKGKLSLRNRRNGDKIVPLGMKGRKKVKDYFIDKKVPREKRDRIPLLADEENIIWILGYKLSDLYKISDKTEKILAIEYEGGNFNA